MVLSIECSISWICWVLWRCPWNGHGKCVGEVQLGGMPPDTPRLALLLRASFFHITHYFYHYDPPQKFLHTPLDGAPQKCFQLGPALAKAGPDSFPQIFSISSHFVISEAASQTKYCCSPKIKHYGSPKI